MNNNLFDHMKEQMNPKDDLIEKTKFKIITEKYNMTVSRDRIQPEFNVYVVRYIAVVACLALALGSVLTVKNFMGSTLPVSTSSPSSTSDF